MKVWKKRMRKGLLAAGLILAAGCSDSCRREPETVPLAQIAEIKTSETAEAVPGGGEPSPGTVPAGAETPAETTTAPCFVHVCGEVVHPGVYELAEGQRVWQAVELAGGFTDRAAADYLNLAEPVKDGMKCVVPSLEALAADRPEAIYGEGGLSPGGSPGTGQAEGTARVNLNTASKEQLMTLKGIGEARAGDIIRYREEHGGFARIEDIMKVPGIKDAAFQKIKEDVTV